ncbi:SigE family RNA polymerase sigma factor [Nocardioides bizhenqiangii]|uniref:SigE family RNA polymerase sigma factor n=1 Tax=Nocardioides bizhenqiangii TaxID=3095076 RepID=A0ABZ0ZML6_9ACTN|nr:SigE family RNA polymerase sigma factor [Nocardioides sp. HM61]WQQ25505.1 SigE family RNA polymerase sigma factor [Nocardioides sp. HM61]
MRRQEFEEFVDGELPRLLGYARALTGSEHDAWDLTQDALIRTSRRWRRIRRDGNPGAYVRVTIARLNIDRYRRTRREVLVSEVPDSTNRAAPYDGLDAWLRDGLLSLTPRQRTAVVLRYVDDLDLAGIAEVMQCSTGTVKSHLSRGLDRLREHIPEEDRHG